MWRQVRSQFRKIFTQMGFEEMPTNNYVENSFWNFDALFQPQQHPARDAHDTFFLTSGSPASTDRHLYTTRGHTCHVHALRLQLGLCLIPDKAAW